MQVNAKLVRAEPDAVQRFATPELLGEGRALVRWVRFGAEQADRAVGIDLPNAMHSGIGSHTAADDEIGVTVVIHRFSPPSFPGDAWFALVATRCRHGLLYGWQRRSTRQESQYPL